ncbi:serralysin [Paracidovorax valerianellae]|uniref:Serralysin n=2 Tax=Paracidovorax valerianellae TaxID=187868 RepID=A0A1G7AF22_9BURK|nr:serralysin [Paracidovorax valerianellae]
MASLIRIYTETQYQLRYGTSIPLGKMQEASNAVAQNLFDDLLGRNEPRWPAGQIPDIARIGEADATAVGRILFNVDLADTGAALQQNSAWSGTLLFSLLRSDQTNRLSSTGTLGKIDTLNDWRDVLYSYNAYAAGFKAAQSTLFLESAAQAKVDETVFGATTWGYLKTPESVLSLKDAVILGTDNPVLKKAFTVIGDVGPHKFLDMLMGAVQGKNLIGTTKTDAQFTANARNFLGALTPTQLQSLKAELLPQSASALAGKAMANTPEGASARAALAALSMVSVQVSPEVAARVALYDPATGTGQLSESWIADRAAFTTRYYEQQQRGGGILQGTQNVAYIDMGNGGGTPAVQVLVGAGPNNGQRTQYVFGGSGDDQINGQGFADHLYGGAGADTLDGKGGGDYLEGGAGKDVYRFNGLFGADTVWDADGAGTLEFDGVAMPLATVKRYGADDAWEDTSGQFLFTRVANGQGGTDLRITKYASATDKSVQGTVNVRNYWAGAFGLTLAEAADKPQAAGGTDSSLVVLAAQPDDPTPRISESTGALDYGASAVNDINWRIAV